MLLLALLHFAVNVSTYQMETLPRFSSAVFVATPAAFVFLAYLAFERESGEWLDQPESRRVLGGHVTSAVDELGPRPLPAP